jgi:transketolase
MRVIRPKTKTIYDNDEKFDIGGSKTLRRSNKDVLTIAATGITVFEALKAADQLKAENINIRVVDCYSINPIDKETLTNCLRETQKPILITIEDHFVHGGMGDFAAAALADLDIPYQIEKMAVSKISQSGKMDQLLDDAGIDAAHLVEKIRNYVSQLTSSQS